MTEDNSRAMRDMRKEFARLIEKDPDAFRQCVAEYQRRGAEAFPPVERTGGRPTTPELNLSMLLADYKARPEGERRRDWIERKGSEGVQGCTRFQEVSWMTPDALAAALKKAEKNYHESPEFARLTDFRAWALQVLR